MSINKPAKEGTLITWNITGEPGKSPVEAVREVWRDIFGRDPDMATMEDACFFEVTDLETREIMSVDLGELNSLTD